MNFVGKTWPHPSYLLIWTPQFQAVVCWGAGKPDRKTWAERIFQVVHLEGGYPHELSFLGSESDRISLRTLPSAELPTFWRSFFFFLNSCFMWHVLPSLINSCITAPPLIHFEEELCEMTCKCLTLFRCLFSSKLITCRPSWCPKVLTSDLLVDSIHDFFFYDDRIYITWNLPFPLFLSVCSVTWRIFAWCGHHHHPSPETFHFSELKLYPPNSNFLVLSSLEPLASTHPSTFYV